MINLNFLSDRLKEVESNKYFTEEVALLSNNKVLAYYEHVIKNVEIDKNNKNNSYVMWCVGKVDKIDTSSPAKITAARTALPDIDSDFEVDRREDIISYIKEKYGKERVAQMATYGKIMGRGALKEVLRGHSACSFEEMNEITKFIPDEASITDDLQEMMEEDGEASILKWALENNKKDLAKWCEIKEDGTLDGPFSQFFNQAIRLEGTIKSQGKHASGIIICSENLADICPMIYDKNTNEQIVGCKMNNAEEIGLIKNDILGLACLDKLHSATEKIKAGFI